MDLMTKGSNICDFTQLAFPGRQCHLQGLLLAPLQTYRTAQEAFIRKTPSGSQDLGEDSRHSAEGD